MSLSCCSPTAYDGASRTTVHGPLCDKAEQPLTKAEMAEWIGHPVVSKGSHLRVVEAGDSGHRGGVPARGAAPSNDGPTALMPGYSEPSAPPASSSRKRKRRSIASERWFVGITPELEDFS